MAIKMTSNYSKKLGLPGYSSHMFSVSLETELNTRDDVAGEAASVYQLLQSNVDEQIQKVGFVPPYDYGMEVPGETNGANPVPSAAANTPAGANALAAAIAAAIAAASGPAGAPPNKRPNPATKRTANSGGNVADWQRGPAWKCTDKQRGLILKLVEEHQLDKHSIEALAVERFGHGVSLLDKMEASGLIDELLDTHGRADHSQGAARRNNGSAYKGANERRPP